MDHWVVDYIFKCQSWNLFSLSEDNASDPQIFLSKWFRNLVPDNVTGNDERGLTWFIFIIY